MAHELIAICDECKQAVADGEGSLWVDMAEVDQHTINVRAWKQLEAKPATDRLQTYSFSSLLSYPEPAPWRVHHAACDPAPDANAYAIEVHRCRSWADLVVWTSHLMGKSWLAHTDWSKVLEGAGESLGRRIVPTVPPTLHR
ncbi:hypothetical protein [Streptomyces sp. NBC_01233]|uniref:hypothetical protein n=1 Tax=Streptomyces sp. NBC_01233 TaxID=2903787 RepID=UPI002E160FE3|nr:hypothetical protein OG332_23385 [Streptomyces sp. NBC_01233]